MAVPERGAGVVVESEVIGDVSGALVSSSMQEFALSSSTSFLIVVEAADAGLEGSLATCELARDAGLISRGMMCSA